MKTQQTLSPVYIMGGLRTPIGSYKGQFKSIKPEILGARVLDALYEQYPDVAEIICGNAVGTGGNIGRLTALNSRYGEKTPAYTVDMQCASAGAAIIQAFARFVAAWRIACWPAARRAAPYNPQDLCSGG